MLILSFAILLLAFLLRISLISKWVIGDVLVHREWGEKFWKYGSRNFYFNKDWYYSFPTQPPITSLMFAGSFWLFDHKYVLAQIHNSTKLVPAALITYFYDMEEPVNKRGYILLLKLPAILADLALGILVFKIILDLTRRRNSAILGSLFYLFNPVTVFLSGGWGQNESVIAFFGLLAFVLLAKEKVYLSLPLFFVCLYTKPTWSIFVPLYLFLLFIWRPRVLAILVGVFLSSLIFIVTTLPFSGNDVLGFTKKVFWENTLPRAKVGARASISAFNFHTVFLRIDRDLDNERTIGIPANILGILGFALINVFVFSYMRKVQDKLFGVVVSLFTLGFGSFLFLTNMLERYFFASFAPMIILAVSRPKTLLWALAINTIVFANLVFAYFRRTSDEISRPFTNNNFFLIRALSVLNIVAFVKILKFLNVTINFNNEGSRK